MTIKPFKLDDGREMFVLYIHPYQEGTLRVLTEHRGKNWRRIKRELRKYDLRFRRKAA